eukprot:CAMPEP_0180128678 /NCGR_PEP_ID=MMETSP0986-20121125/6906_1 /TAXON_ID=697907 /ORGANISM="non described non described, Strain CCMP2293" /LENGTH=159 /DNA_ID=CAMNT_0022068287 /DNA_START=3968 /DNA_END=4448 /DNA_ORIENTATION=+
MREASQRSVYALYRSDAEGLVGNSAWRVRGACAGESEERASFRGACAVESSSGAGESEERASFQGACVGESEERAPFVSRSACCRVRGACAVASEGRAPFRGACAVESEERALENPRQVSRRVAELANPLKMESAHCGRPDGGSGFHAESEVEIESGDL